MSKISRIKYEFQDEVDHIRVIDNYPENHRYLHFEDSIQGALDLSNMHTPVLEYVGLMAEGARLMNQLPSRILLGGLGSCGLLHAVNNWWRRHAHIETIEYSERIAQIARRFFRLRASDKITIGDLRATIEEDDFLHQDLILIDCYSATSIPPHLTTLQFMTLLWDNLSEDGAVIFNLWSPACNELCGDQLRTMMEVFEKVAVVTCREDQNLVVFVSKNPQREWPGSIIRKGQRYDLRVWSLSQEDYWPDYLKESEVISDENMGDFFTALAIEF